MRKRYLFLFAFIFMLFSVKINALSSCSMERTMELTSLANNVNVDYDEYHVEKGSDVYIDLEEGETVTEPGFKIRIYNMTKDLNVLITDNSTREEKELTFNDISDDGILYYDSGFPGEIKNYTITVRSADYNCLNEVFRKVSITLPMINNFYDYDVCRDNQDYYMCQEYTTVDYSNVSVERFIKQVKEYEETKKNKEINESSFMYRFLIFIKKYIWLIIVIILLGVGYYVYTRNKNSKGVK